MSRLVKWSKRLRIIKQINFIMFIIWSSFFLKTCRYRYNSLKNATTIGDENISGTCWLICIDSSRNFFSTSFPAVNMFLQPHRSWSSFNTSFFCIVSLLEKKFKVASNSPSNKQYLFALSTKLVSNKISYL